ncbi:MAG: glycosyltransferase family 9 protein [Fimbriimonadaceae bacterium]|nr:glycosyltransferase family 9 protein [Chthonomonadaceae bacterium]MCO5297625.1 glycosyltransferase family 9 protein [Fimbriimonadaceae bacterium]
MRRFTDDAWQNGWRVAVLANDAIGNFVVATPLLQRIRETKPASLHYFGGVRTRELEDASDLPDRTFPLHGSSLQSAYESVRDDLPFDVVVNLEQTPHSAAFASLIGEGARIVGPCLAPDGRGELPFEAGSRGDLWRDTQWVAENLPARFPMLQTGFIGEIFCRLAYFDGPIPPYRVPSASPTRPVPDVLVACSASLPEKLWPEARWLEALAQLKQRGVSIGVLGAPKASQGRYWKGGTVEDVVIDRGLASDLRGAFTLPQVVGALGKARAVLTLDNGILHLAAATATPTIGLFREGIHRLWCPPAPNVRALVPESGDAVASIEPSRVVGAVNDAL